MRGRDLREEQSLAAFLELIIFKFLSDIGVSFDNGTGDIYDYDYVNSHNNSEQNLEDTSKTVVQYYNNYCPMGAMGPLQLLVLKC